MSNHKESGMREVGGMTSVVELCKSHVGGMMGGYFVCCPNCGEVSLPKATRIIPWNEVPTLELQEVQVNKIPT